jgi:hypothetical protein
MSDSTLEGVLEDFAAEPTHDKAILEQYIREYPQFAIELIDLSRNLLRTENVDPSPLTANETALVDAAWRSQVAATHPEARADPFAALDVAKSREIAKALDIPRQVIMGLQERRAKPASIPRRFLGQLAAKMNATADALAAALALPAPQPAYSYKADEKPAVPAQVTFEQLLIDANVAAHKRAALLAEGD